MGKTSEMRARLAELQVLVVDCGGDWLAWGRALPRLVAALLALLGAMVDEIERIKHER